MSLACRQAIDLLPAYSAEALARAQRRELREHLAECPTCREEASRSDVGLLFAHAPMEEIPAQDITRILAGVRAGIALRQTERKLADAPRRPRRRGLVAAAAAAVALTLAFPGAPPRHSPARAVTAGLGRRMSGEGPLVPADRAIEPVQEVPDSKFPADATVYDWNPGSGQPRVVWIVDRSLDI